MFERLLERIANALDGTGIPYMVIGGQAVLLYGEPRLTKDIAITLGVDLDRLADVLRIIKSIDLKPLVDPDTFTRQTMVLPCADPTTGIRVDLIFSFTPYEQQAMTRVKAVKVGGADIRFASLEDLIVHKMIAGRPRDIEDVRSVLVKNAGVDLPYIRHWLGQFSDSSSESLVTRFNQIVDETQQP